MAELHGIFLKLEPLLLPQLHNYLPPHLPIDQVTLVCLYLSTNLAREERFDHITDHTHIHILHLVPELQKFSRPHMYPQFRTFIGHVEPYTTLAHVFEQDSSIRTENYFSFGVPRVQVEYVAHAVYFMVVETD